MTETQKWNGTPVSQEIRKLLFPFQTENTLYILQWIRTTLRIAEGLHLTSEIMTPEEAENLEMLTFSGESEARRVYGMLVPVNGEPWSSNDLLKQIREVSKTNDLMSEAEARLLQMFKENLDNSGADLAPSLHAEDR